MTTAPQLAVGTTTQGIDDASFSIFQLLNGPVNPTLVCGNFFLGLQSGVAVVVPLGELKGLDRGANIETALTNATVSFVANGNWTAGGTINVNAMLDDSPRRAVSPALDSRLAWKPPGGYGPNVWRRDSWGVFDQRLEDTGGTPFLDNGVGNSGSFAILPLAGVRDRLAARFTVPAGPSWSVARAILELRRFGNPTGSMEVAIQGAGANAELTAQPDGIDLGVSAAVLNSTVPLTPGSGPITFAFAPDVVLPPGDYWTVLRPSVPYVPNFADFVVWMQKRQFLGVGGSHFHSGNYGVRLDQANYPGHYDMSLDMAAKPAGTPIVWNPIARVAGQTVSTPDLSPLVHEVIRNSGHETTSAICFTFTTVGETRTYRFASHDHATRNPPGFACQFRRRQHRGFSR